MIFFDMDGTLAKFYDDSDCLEKMYNKGFFLNLKPYKMVKLVRELAKKNKVCILSACVDSEFCKAEKIAWLKKYIPELVEDNILLCSTKENKINVAKEYINYYGLDDKYFMLVDDYSKNLYDWVIEDKKFIAVKYINGLNNKTNKNYQYKVKTNKQLKNLIDKMDRE